MIIFANRMDQDQAQQYVWSDPDPNCSTLWWYSRKIWKKSYFEKVQQTTKKHSKTCVKWPHSKRPKIGLQEQLSLNAGQKYCRMLQMEHSAILSTFSKLQFVIRILLYANLPSRQWVKAIKTISHNTCLVCGCFHVASLWDRCTPVLFCCGNIFLTSILVVYFCFFLSVFVKVSTRRRTTTAWWFDRGDIRAWISSSLNSFPSECINDKFL